VCRIIVYQDKQTNGTQSQGEDVISSGAASGAIDMFQNINNFGRFKILKDKKIQLQPHDYSGLTTAFVAHATTIPFKINVKVNEWVNYNATNGGTVADVIDNSFHLICGCNTINDAPTIDYKVRTVFSP